MILRATESEIQSAVIQYLKLVGCDVLINTVKMRGRADGRHQTGQSKGISDISFRHPKWILPIWVLLEIKREGKENSKDGWHWSCPEQKVLFDKGATVKAHSIDDAKAIFDRLHPLLCAHGIVRRTA